jgi:hypothetical protein
MLKYYASLDCDDISNWGEEELRQLEGTGMYNVKRDLDPWRFQLAQQF